MTIDGNGSTFNQTNGDFVFGIGNRVTGENGQVARFAVQNFTCTASSGGCIFANGGVIYVGPNVTFGTVTLDAHERDLRSDRGSVQLHDLWRRESSILKHRAACAISQVKTITCTGSPAFGAAPNSGFAFSGYLGQVYVGQITFSGCGSVTGKRFAGIEGGLIHTGVAGSNPAYLPGNVPGTLRGNAIYGLNNGTSGNPQYLATLTASNSASLNFTSIITSEWDTYEFVFENVVPVTNAVSLEAQYSQDNGGSWLTTSYVNQGATSTTGVRINTSVAIDNTAGRGLSGKVALMGPNRTDNNKILIGNAAAVVGGAISSTAPSGFYSGNQAAVNAIRFIPTSGNIASGKIRVYGIPTLQ